MRLRVPLVVLAGGALGTALRLGLDAALPHAVDGWPWSTLAVNLVGSFVLGLLVARVWPSAPDWLRAGLGTGLLGSFTTFSAVAVSWVAMTVDGRGGLALLYVAVSLVAGLAAAWAGLALGGHRRHPRLEADE